MNLNLSAYAIFISAMLFIILRIGRIFYRNGRLFMLGILGGDAGLTDHVNSMLLTCYYLLNIGYTLIELQFWEKVTTLNGLIAGTSHKMGLLILILGAIHYVNLTAIYLLSRWQIISKSNKKFQS